MSDEPGLSPQVLLEALGLKALPRTGWARAGIPAPESVAAHCWGMAWLALVFCPPGLDLARVLALAILHDLPEVRVGDLTPHDGVSPAEKRRREAEAARGLLAGRPDLLALIGEYAAGQTAEARFVHGLDRLDLGLQALYYARTHGVGTGEFLASARAGLAGPLAAMLDAIIAAEPPRST